MLVPNNPKCIWKVPFALFPSSSNSPGFLSSLGFCCSGDVVVVDEGWDGGGRLVIGGGGGADMINLIDYNNITVYNDYIELWVT